MYVESIRGARTGGAAANLAETSNSFFGGIGLGALGGFGAGGAAGAAGGGGGMVGKLCGCVKTAKSNHPMIFRYVSMCCPCLHCV